MQPLDNSRYARSVLSNSTRRDVLWNVSEPGDPYDIKKSMIAKLPGDKKVFMGEHLELVCLLQAAEIQRLCEFLDEYKLKFREIERNNLDRHSYEVQIKELTEKVSGEETLRTENNKLKDFSKRLQGEIQFLQRNSREGGQQEENYKISYERTLQRLNELIRENQDLKHQIQESRYQILNFNARLEALERAKNREIEDLKLNYSQFSKESYESAIAAYRLQSDSEIKRLEYETKRLRELNETKNSEITQLQTSLKVALDDIRRLNIKDQEVEQLDGQVRDYENKFVIFGTEIERLNIALRDYTNKFEESERRRRDLDGKEERLGSLNTELENRLRSQEQEINFLNEQLSKLQAQRRKGTSQQIIFEFQSKLNSYSRDIDSLNARLKSQSENSKRLREEVERLTFENSKYRLIDKDNLALKEGMSEINILKKRVAELENKNMIQSQEIERLQYTLKVREGELEKYKGALAENQSLKTRITQIEYSYTSRSQIEISRLKSQYEQKLEYLSRSQGSEWQSRVQNYEAELERLRSTLKLKSEDTEKLRNRIYELEITVNRGDVENSNKIKNYELNITNLKRDNEQLYNKLKIAGENQRKLFQFQNKLVQYQRELERVNLNLKNRDEEIITLRSKIRDLQGLIQKYEFEANKSKAGFDQNFNSLRQENENLNRKLLELVNESNKKLSEASQEVDRLGLALRNKNEEKIQLQVKNKQLAQEGEYLKQNLQRITAEDEELKRRIFQLEAKLNNILNDSGSNIRSLTQENDLLKKQINDLKNQTNLYQFEITKKNTIFEQNALNISKQNDDLKRRINEYQGRLPLVSQEIERLGFQLKSKTEECNLLRSEYDKFKLDFKQYENDVNNHMQLTVKKKFKQFEQRIQDLSRQNQDLKQRNAESVAQFNSQMERLSNSLRQLAQENQNLKVELKKQINERREESNRFELIVKQLTSQNELVKKQFKDYEISVNQKLEGDIQRKMKMFQETITSLTQQNDELKRRLQQFEKLRQSANSLAQQNEALKRRVEGYESSFSTYELEIKKRFASFEQNNALLNKENQELRRKLQEASELNRKLAEYQSRLAILSQELERVTNGLNAKMQENQNLRKQLNEKHAQSSNLQLEISRKVTTYESNLTYLQKQNQDLKKRLSESDLRLRNTNAELEKISSALRIKTEEYNRLEISIKTYQGEVLKTISGNQQNLNALLRQNEDLKKKIVELGDVNRRAIELENRLALVSQELQRLGINLKSKQEECQRLELLSRNQANQLEAWRKKYNDLQTNFNNTYEFQIKKKFTSYQQTIYEFNRRNTETEAKLNNSTQEIERLNNILRLKVDESTQNQTLLKKLTIEFEQYQRKVRDNEQNFSQNSSSLKRDNDELRRRIQQFQTYITQFNLENERKQAQIQNKFKAMSQEIERLNNLLKSKQEELNTIKKQFKEYEYSVTQKFQGEVKTSFIQYQSHISSLTKQTDQLRRKLKEAGDLDRKLAEYENKIVLLSQQMQRLNVIINNKADQNKKIIAQNEELRRKLIEASEFNRKLPEYEQRLALILQENEKLQYGLRNKTDQLSSLDLKYKQLQQENQNLRKNIANIQYTWSSKFESQVTRKTMTYEQNLSSFNREKEEFLRKKAEYETKIANLGQQLERLNAILRSKTEENTKLAGEIQLLKKLSQQRIQTTQGQFLALQNNYSAMSKEYESAKRHLLQYEQSIRKLYTQFERLQGIINEQKKENQNLHTMNHNLSTEINRLTVQNKDLQQQTQEVRLRLSDESALQKRINEHLALMVVLFAEIETLRNRVKDKEKEVAEVRRSSIAPNIL